MDQPAVYVWRGLDLFAGYGADEAIVLVDSGRRVSYAELRSGVLDMASALRAHGIRSGQAVAVLTPHAPETVMVQYALHLLGCRSVWIASSAPYRDRLDYLRRAELDAFIYDPRVHAELGPQFAGDLPSLSVLCLGPGGQGPDLLAPLPEDAPRIDRAEPVDEPTSLFQTGGTTGRPKLVHHRHSFFQALAALSGHWTASGQPPPRHLLVSGLWHISSQVQAMMTLFTGGTLVMLDEWGIESLLGVIERERLTSILLSPALLAMVLDHPALEKADTSSLTMFTIGGSAAAPARLTQAIDRLGPVMRPVYGMSEAPFITALPGLTHDPRHPKRLSSCGLPFGEMRIEIHDEKGGLLPPGEIGEVWVTGGLMMAGYWGQPDLTAETLVDGWLRTGDAGYLDSDGYLYLVDRLKDMIIVGLGAANVYSRSVEDCLAAHPAVRAAAVIGVPDPLADELIHAYVVRAPDAEVTAEELRAWVTGELNALYSPAAVDFVDTLPLTEFGKVDKKALRAVHQAQHAP